MDHLIRMDEDDQAKKWLGGKSGKYVGWELILDIATIDIWAGAFTIKTFFFARCGCLIQLCLLNFIVILCSMVMILTFGRESMFSCPANQLA